MKGNITAVITAASLSMFVASTASSNEKDEKGDKARDDVSSHTCVQLSRVRDTTVIDDQTILFELRDGSLYRNFLPHTCPNLSREKRFGYRVTANRLCDIDTITVLEDFGFGLSPGATCRLGSFDPITKEAAEDLKAGPHKSLIEAEQVDPGETEGDAAASAENESAGTDAGASSETEAVSSDATNGDGKDKRRRSRKK